ncbi:MAG: hypothetical protein ACOZAA_01415 [Pseudomonadota bacterium]
MQMFRRVVLIAFMTGSALLPAGCGSTGEKLREKVGEPVKAEGYEPLPSPTFGLLIGDVYYKDGDGVDYVCNLYGKEGPPSSMVRSEGKVLVDSSGKKRTQIGGFLSLLSGVFGKNSAAEAGVRAGWSRVSEYSISWGDVTAEKLDFRPEEGSIFAAMAASCRDFVRDAVADPEIKDAVSIVIGKATADSLTASFKINPEDSTMNEQALAPGLVGDDPDAANVPTPACDLQIGVDANAPGLPFKLGGQVGVCQRGSSDLVFSRPYVVGTRSFAPTKVELLGGKQFTEGTTRVDGVASSIFNMTEPSLTAKEKLKQKKLELLNQ